MGKTDSTLRNMCKSIGADIVSDVSQAILTRLKEVGAVMRNAKTVALIQMADVVKLSVNNKATWEALTWHVKHSKQPPPRSSFNKLPSSATLVADPTTRSQAEAPQRAPATSQPNLLGAHGLPVIQEPGEMDDDSGKDDGGEEDDADYEEEEADEKETKEEADGMGLLLHAAASTEEARYCPTPPWRQRAPPIKEGGTNTPSKRTAAWRTSGGRRLDAVFNQRAADVAAQGTVVKRAREVSPPRPSRQGRVSLGATTIPQGEAAISFPSAPPVVLLSAEERSGPYAMKDPTASLKREIEVYEEWCGAPVNTERSLRYIKAVQSTSLAKTQAMVMAFAGVVKAHYAIRREDINLGIYANPTYIARFVGFLQVCG